LSLFDKDQYAAVIGVAAIIATAATPAVTAPVPSSTALLKSAVASDVSEVRWRGRGGADSDTSKK